MKKFLAVFDGFHFSGSTLRFAVQLASQAQAQLVGVFLDELSYRTYNVGSVLTSEENPDKALRALEAKDKARREEAVRQFQAVCGKAGVHYTVHRDQGIAIQELIQESMFADLLIIDKHENFSRRRQSPPTPFIRHLLASLQCPALLVPATYRPVDHIVLLYDGQPSSTYAFRQFSYLLGGLEIWPVELLSVRSPADRGTRLVNHKLIREWMKRHFPKAMYTVKKGDPEMEIVKHLENYGVNQLLVLGAYRRGEVSRWFRSSMADTLMKKLDTPLFIAHNK